MLMYSLFFSAVFSDYVDYVGLSRISLETVGQERPVPELKPGAGWMMVRVATFLDFSRNVADFQIKGHLGSFEIG